jgi:hypothetical protein
MSMRIRSEHITQGELADEIGNNLLSASVVEMNHKVKSNGSYVAPPAATAEII